MLCVERASSPRRNVTGNVKGAEGSPPWSLRPARRVFRLFGVNRRPTGSPQVSASATAYPRANGLPGSSPGGNSSPRVM